MTEHDRTSRPTPGPGDGFPDEEPLKEHPDAGRREDLDTDVVVEQDTDPHHGSGDRAVGPGHEA